MTHRHWNKSIDFKVGDYVLLTGKEGYIRYIGERLHDDGIWYGIELIIGNGPNDGSEHGERYFSCKLRKGIFVRSSAIKCKMNENEHGDTIYIDNNRHHNNYNNHNKTYSDHHHNNNNNTSFESRFNLISPKSCPSNIDKKHKHKHKHKTSKMRLTDSKSTANSSHLKVKRSKSKHNKSKSISPETKSKRKHRAKSAKSRRQDSNIKPSTYIKHKKKLSNTTNYNPFTPKKKKTNDRNHEYKSNHLDSSNGTGHFKAKSMNDSPTNDMFDLQAILNSNDLDPFYDDNKYKSPPPKPPRNRRSKPKPPPKRENQYNKLNKTKAKRSKSINSLSLSKKTKKSRKHNGFHTDHISDDSDDGWQCHKCLRSNVMEFKFCPNCGQKRPLKEIKLKISVDSIELKQGSDEQELSENEMQSILNEMKMDKLDGLKKKDYNKGGTGGSPSPPIHAINPINSINYDKYDDVMNKLGVNNKENMNAKQILSLVDNDSYNERYNDIEESINSDISHAYSIGMSGYEHTANDNYKHTLDLIPDTPQFNEQLEINGSGFESPIIYPL